MKVDLLIIATIHLLTMGGFSFDQKGFSGVDLKNNTTTSAPTVNDDSSKGYSFGSCWYNQSSGKLYILVDSSEGAANWISVNGENYKGSWDASTNTPALADGFGISGDNYKVSVAGSQNLGSGTIAFTVSDLVIYNGTIWEKIEGGVSYVPEDVANKSTDGTMAAEFGTGSDTLYPSQKAVVTYVKAKVEDSITDGVTTIAPSQNAVFDALALKQTIAKDTSGGYAGLTLFKINFKNVANTFTSFFTNSNTAARTYTFQNRDGTILDSTDLGTINTSLGTKQDSNLNLTSLASLSLSADDLLYATGANTITTTTLTATARTVLDDNDTNAMLTTLAGGAASTGSGGLVCATSPALVNPALGTVASGNIANCTGYTAANLPAGVGLNIVSVPKLDTASTTSSTYAAIAGMSASITPVSTSSTVLVTVVLNVGGVALQRAHFQLFRGTTQIGLGDTSGLRSRTSAAFYSANAGAMASVNIEFLDSPATAASVTYSVKWASPDNTSAMYINRTSTDTSAATIPRTISSITLKEFHG
jgi:hypothetical protein